MGFGGSDLGVKGRERGYLFKGDWCVFKRRQCLFKRACVILGGFMGRGGPLDGGGRVFVVGG